MNDPIFRGTPLADWPGAMPPGYKSKRIGNGVLVNGGGRAAELFIVPKLRLRLQMALGAIFRPVEVRLAVRDEAAVVGENRQLRAHIQQLELDARIETALVGLVMDAEKLKADKARDVLHQREATEKSCSDTTPAKPATRKRSAKK